MMHSTFSAPFTPFVFIYGLVSIGLRSTTCIFRFLAPVLFLILSSIGGLFLNISNSLALSSKKDFHEVLATIGNRKLTLGEFEKKFDDLLKEVANPPTRAQFLEDLIRYEIGLQEAKKKQIINDPEVQERIKKEQYKALIEKEIGEKTQKIRITEDDMRTFYKKNPEIRYSHILIQLGPGATEAQRKEAKKRASEILAEVKVSKAPFFKLVRAYSDDVYSKQTGGDVGWQSSLTLSPAYYETLVKIKDGEIFGLIESQYGFHIVKMIRKRSYEDANKNALRAAVFDEKRRHLFNEYFDGLKKNYAITTNKSLLN